jgi:hypothetical protein
VVLRVDHAGFIGARQARHLLQAVQDLKAQEEWRIRRFLQVLELGRKGGPISRTGKKSAGSGTRNICRLSER